MGSQGDGSGALDLPALARRALQRALAERANEKGPTGVRGQAAGSGVHVSVDSPPAPAAKLARGRGPELIDAASLRATADGANFVLPRGALVNELAREEAARRRIRLVEGSLAAPRAVRRIALGSDHGGFALKREIQRWLGQLESVGVDMGTRDENPCDYPDFARAVAEAVASGEVDFGILIDGAGIGSAMAANKVPGARAANCADVGMARNAREHNFANVLTLSAALPRNLAYQVIHAFLSTPTGAERHKRRVDKISAIETHYAQRQSPR
jgi:ribose 5-phosphate isomerase B